MPAQIPAWLLTEPAVVEPYQGITAAGPEWDDPRVVRVHVQETRSRRDSGEHAGKLRVWARLGLAAPIGSRVRVRDIDTTVTSLDVNDGRTLPVPSHLELTCERVVFMASSLVTILRGLTTPDAYGDPVDDATPVVSGVPALIVQTDQDTNRPVDQRGGVVETFRIRLAAGTDVREGDRLVDDRTTAVYIAERLDVPLSTVGPALGTDDVLVTCRRVAATSIT